MLLIEFPINGVTQRISDELLALEHQWKPYVVAFSPPSYAMDKEHGGMVRFGGGSITISNQLFKDLDVWPPPVQATPTAKYTATNEAAEVTLFTHLAHLVSFNNTDVTYDIRETEWDDYLLDETTDVSENDAVVPVAFGTVNHVTPLQLADSGPYQCFHLGGLQTGTTPFWIEGITSVSGGAASKIITDGSHGFSNGDTINIVGTDWLDGAHVISNAESVATEFTIPVAFTEESMPLNAQCYATGAILVYDSGRPLDTVIINGDGTFSLSLYVENPGGITMSGTAAYTTLDDVMDWAHTKLGITTYTNTYGRSPSPHVSKWITSQQPVVDFLSDLCSFFTHLFYIKADALVLVDMFKDNGSRTLTEYQFFKSPSYNKVNPLKRLTATWETREAVVDFIDNDYAGGQHHFVKATENKIEEQLFSYGDEVDVEVFHDVEANIRSALICLRSAYYEKDQASISIPISGTLPEPGEKISWSDASLPIDTPGYIRACNINYDFIGHEIQISGPGVFIRTGLDGTII